MIGRLWLICASKLSLSYLEAAQPQSSGGFTLSAYEHFFESYGKPLRDPSVQLRFTRRAGAVYGLIFGLGFAILLWLPDAIQLQQVSAYLAWAKLPIGLILCPLIGIVSGYLTSRARWVLLSGIIWAIGAAAIAWAAGHIPYEGVNWIASLNPPTVHQTSHPFYLFAALSTGISIVAGAIIGFITGLFQLFAVGRAWEHATATNSLSGRSILALALCLPLAGVFAFTADTTINGPIRRPVVDVAWSIERARDPATDLRAERLDFLSPYRNQLTSSYTLYWNGVEADQDANLIDIVDVVFDTGLILRCQYKKVNGSSMVYDCSPFIPHPSAFTIQPLIHRQILAQPFDIQPRFRQRNILHE